MKRALAVCTVLAVLGFSAFGIGTFTGSWSATVKILPSAALLANKLTINYTDFGWTFTGILSLTGAASDTFQAKVKGALGPFSLTGNMWFDYPNAAYMGADLSTSLDIAGLSVGFTVRHWDKDYADFFFTDSAPWYAWVWYPDEEYCEEYAEETGMIYIINTKVEPVSLKVRFLDCSSGIEFYDAVIGVSGIGLCCGISLDAELAFAKEEGFQYLKFTGINIPLCCGVSLDVGVKFTTSGKELDTKFKFAGFADACFKVWGDALGEPPAWTGLTIYAYKISCSLGDCSSFTVVTAFDPAWYNDNVENVFKTTEGEFEYMALTLCGPGCCGGQYKVTLYTYFTENPGKLFGINRFRGVMSIPVMSNLTFTVDFRTPAELRLGWTFTF